MAELPTPYTLIIPSWYPSREFPLNGIFINKHVEAISSFENVVVMHIVSTHKQASTCETISDSYIKYTYYYQHSNAPAINQLRYILTQKRAYDDICRLYGKPGRIHLHVVLPAGIFVFLLLLFRNIPLIITEHWSGYTAEDGRYRSSPSPVRYIVRELFRKAKKISVVSDYLRKALTDLHFTDPGKISIVSNVLNIPAPAFNTDNPNPKKALFIGTLNDHEKNVSMLIEAVKIVSLSHPGFELTMVGWSDEAQKFINLAAQKGILNKNIFFIGAVPNDELTDIYTKHGFFILTSHFETFNIAAAEALLYGLPVVSTQCGGPAEFIKPENGIWIKEKTPEATADTIIEMLQKRSTFDSRSLSAEMAGRYGYDKIVAQLKNLYNIDS